MALAPAAASADPPAAADTSQTSTTQPNRDTAQAQLAVSGIDRAQAAKAGNHVVVRDRYDVLIDGDTGDEIARVPQESNSANESRPSESHAHQGGPPSGPTTQDYTYGDCGSAYIFLYEDPSLNWGQFETGFHLAGEAYDFDWYIHIYSHGGTENDYWEDHGPLWPSPSWSSGRKGFYTVASGDLHDAYVQYGRAYLTDGRICDALRPYDYNVRVY